MDINERLTFFLELVQCNHPLHLWDYDKEFQLQKTDCPADFMHPDIISMLGFAPLVLSHVNGGKRTPLVLTTEFGLLWVAGFEYQNFSLHRIHIIGPAFSGNNSHFILRKKLDSYQLSVKLRAKIVSQIESVPIIPSQTLLSYAVMLHCAITGERISADMVTFASLGQKKAPEDAPFPADEHPGVWMAEQTFLNLIRAGSPDYKKALSNSMMLSSGMKAEIGDSVRMSQNNILVLLTLCSRASIEGGLSPAVAYTLNDYYAGRIEECRTIADTANLGSELLEDYVNRIRAANATDEHARQIQNICDYIRLHVKEPLSISMLADKLGYAEYYFSCKFKEVTGCTVNAYIRSAKIDEAKLLLCGTRMDIQEISDELSFCSRSYFFSCFKKECGCSPSEYRRKYTKI